MAGKVKHRFISPVVDENVTGEVGPSEWNDSLVVSEGADGDVMVRRTSVADGWELIKLASPPLWVNSTTAGTSGAAETDLHSHQIPAGHLSVNNKAVCFYAWGDFAANANAKTLRFKVGGTTVVCNPTTGSPNAKRWRVKACLIRTGASAELLWVECDINGIATEEIVSATPAENTANAITCKWTGQGTANNDIRILASHVAWLG